MPRKTPILLATLASCLMIPQGRAAEDTLDWLLNQPAPTPSAPTPSTQPATRPASPFAERHKNPEARTGTILLSSGEKIRGDIATTREKPIRIWDEQEKEYRDVPFALIKSIEARILWERNQEEWHFPEAGSDKKEFTGKTYPARELIYTVTLVNDQPITGGIVAPLYAAAGEAALTFILHKRQKGEVGQTLKDLVYVKRVELE